MEFTTQTTLQFPAAYAPISEEEMIYIEGGADISPAQFTYNLVTNFIRLAGQALFQQAVTGWNNARADGLTTGGALRHYWTHRTPLGKAMTFVGVGLAGYAVYAYTAQLINTALYLYKDMKDNYFPDSTAQDTTASSTASADPTAATTAALTAA